MVVKYWYKAEMFFIFGRIFSLLSHDRKSIKRKVSIMIENK